MQILQLKHILLYQLKDMYLHQEFQSVDMLKIPLRHFQHGLDLHIVNLNTLYIVLCQKILIVKENLPIIQWQVLHLLLYYIFNESDASIKYESVETDSNGEYKIALEDIFGITPHKIILAIYSNTLTITGSILNQYNAPCYIISAIYFGQYGKIADSNRYIVIQVYKINDNGQLVKPTDKFGIQIYYYIGK